MNRAAYGHVPDPIRLCDAAELISREPACGGWSHQAIHEALIAASWRGEFEQDGRSVVFTLGTPPGASVGDDRTIFYVDEDNERLQDVMDDDRERIFWNNRSEIVAALLKWDRDFIPPRYSTPDALFRALSTWSLEQWSSVARYMFWDQLWISLADLSDWLSRAEQSMPCFVGRERLMQGAVEADSSANRSPGKIGSETACRQWLEGLMRAGDREKSKPEYQAEAQKKFSGLSGQGFNRAWADAIEASGNKSWSRAGRLR
jgi:hypothetical protein